MTLRAVAFHESISRQRLDELFGSDANVLFAGTTAAACAKCKRRFAVFFPSKDDPQNDEYLGRVSEMIAADCKDGRHATEYAFETVP